MAKTKLQFMFDNRLAGRVSPTGKHSFSEAVMEVVRRKGYQFAMRAASDASASIGKKLVAQSKGGPNYFGMYNITGNMSESVGIAVSGTKDGHLSVIPFAPFTSANGGNQSTTRPSLGKGEKYEDWNGKTLTAYQNGYVFKPGKSYKGRLPFGGRRGRDERQKFVEELRTVAATDKKGIFNIFVFVAMPYARYVEAQHHIRLCEWFAVEVANKFKSVGSDVQRMSDQGEEWSAW